MSHQPHVKRTDTEEVTCAESGVIAGGGPEGEDVSCTTLADLEAFCAELRALGAQDGLLLDNNGATFTVTINRLGRAARSASVTQTIAVDFDGVIHAYSRGWQDGSIYDEPVPGAFTALRSLMERYAVFIHTTRNAADVGRWIKARSGIETSWYDDPKRECEQQFWNDQTCLLVTSRKLPAVAYIDDRAVRFVSWDQALAFMDSVSG